MAVALDAVRGIRGVRVGVLLAKSVAVCVAVGATVGAAAWLTAGALVDGEAARLAYLPIITFYALPIAIPFGALSGVIGALAVAAVSWWKRPPPSRTAWVYIGGIAGLAVGATCPAFLWASGFGMETMAEVTFWAIVGAAAGGTCGLAVGWLGWNEVRRTS